MAARAKATAARFPALEACTRAGDQRRHEHERHEVTTRPAAPRRARDVPVPLQAPHPQPYPHLRLAILLGQPGGSLPASQRRRPCVTRRCWARCSSSGQVQPDRTNHPRRSRALTRIGIVRCPQPQYPLHPGKPHVAQQAACHVAPPDPAAGVHLYREMAARLLSSRRRTAASGVSPRRLRGAASARWQFLPRSCPAAMAIFAMKATLATRRLAQGARAAAGRPRGVAGWARRAARSCSEGPSRGVGHAGCDGARTAGLAGDHRER